MTSKQELQFNKKLTSSDFSYRPDKTQKINDNVDINNQNIISFDCPVDHEGTTVFVKFWKAPNSNKPPIIIIHDLGEYLGLYKYATEIFLNFGHSVVCFDLRGHGASGRKLGHISNFGVFINDLLQVAVWTRHKCNGVPPIIVANGISAIISVYFQQKYPRLVTANILGAPCFKLNYKVSGTKKILINFLSEILPEFKLPRFLTPYFIDPNLLKNSFKINSSLTLPKYPGISSKFAEELLIAMENIQTFFLRINNNTLLLFPEKDSVCDYSIIKEMLQDHPHKNNFIIKKIKNVNHYIFSNKKDVVKKAIDISIDWINGSLN